MTGQFVGKEERRAVTEFKCPKYCAMRIELIRVEATVLICRAHGAYRIEALFSTGSRRWLSKCRRYAASEPAPLISRNLFWTSLVTDRAYIRDHHFVQLGATT
jgi:hypothetical protein